MPHDHRSRVPELAPELVIATLLALAVAFGSLVLGGCCAAPVAARQDAAADLVAAHADIAQAWAGLKRDVVPHPSYDEAARAEVVGLIGDLDAALVKAKAAAQRLADEEGAK